jgi:hypothetical protein
MKEEIATVASIPRDDKMRCASLAMTEVAAK